MRSPLLPLLFLLAAPACQTLHGDSEWDVLFDGSDTTGWAMAGPGGFKVDDGAMTAHGGMGLYWFTEKSYADFELQFEFKVSDKSNNSGVFVRFPYPERDGVMNPWVAVDNGYEFQICDTAQEKHNTGSAYSFQGVTHVPTKPVGEWNHYSVTAVGQQYTIRINGEVVNEFTGERGTEGFIGMQNHDDGSPVAFRNVRAREL